MRLSILVTNEHVETVRQIAAENTSLPPYAILAIPVSATGQEPATHWYCNFKVSQEMCDRLLSLQNLSEMEITMNWKKFLNTRSLQVIKS